MITRVLMTAGAALLIWSSSPARADEACVGLEKLVEAPPAKTGSSESTKQTRRRRVAAEAPPSGVACSSLRTVLNELSGGSRPGGRRLENDPAPDPEAGRKDLDKALAAPEIAGHFQDIEAAVADPVMQRIYKAAVLDSAGHYAARTYLVNEALKSESGESSP